MKNNYVQNPAYRSENRLSNHKHIVLLMLSFLFLFSGASAQSTIVFSDNFNRGSSSAFPGEGGVPSMTWTSYSTLSPAANIVTWGVTGSSAEDRVLQIFGTNTSASTGNPGRTYMVGPISDFKALFNPTLDQNLADVTWTFNWRSNKSGSTLTGFDLANSAYGQAVVLVASGSDFIGTGTNGYAVTLTGLGSSTVSERIVKLVRFQDGLTSNENITSLVASSAGTLIGTNYSSIKVVYSPATNTWKFYVRDDASSTIAKDPTIENETLGYYTLVGSEVDNTYTSVAMSSCGFFYNHGISSTGSNSKAMYDNFGVSVSTTTASDDARLSELNVDKNGGTNYTALTKFSSDVYNYSYFLTKNQSVIPTVSAVKLDASASNPVITPATSLTGTQSERTTLVSVTAENGVSSSEYSIEFIKTENVFLDGLTSTVGGIPPSGWQSTQMYFSTNAGNDKYQGSGYVRCISTSKASTLTLPQTISVGTLRFYARKIDTGVVGNIKVSIKTDAGNWTEVKDFGDIDNNTYQEFEVPVNQEAVDSMFVRLDITKNGDTFASAGYYFDDFSYNESIGTGLMIGTEKLCKISDVANGFLVEVDDAVLQVYDVTGKLLINKHITGKECVYPGYKGVYIINVETKSKREKIKHIIK